MNCPNEIKHGKYVLREANAGDSADIRRIFESGSFSGGLDVQFLRGDDPLGSFAADGDRAHVLVVDDTEVGELIAVGGAVVRTEFLGGAPAKCAYLTGLKIRSERRGRLTFIPEAYAMMHSLTSDCAATYTTVLDSNTGVIKMFEKRHRGMPEYRYLGHCTTFCIGRGKRLADIETNNTAGFEELLLTHFSHKDLSPCVSSYEGFGNRDFHCIRDSSGRIAACCFIGDQSRTKYYRMCAYGGIYKLISHLPTSLFGYPAFPEAGGVIKNGVVSYLYVRDNDPKLCRDFLYSAAHESGYPMLLWGGYDSDPLCSAVGRLRTVRYGSRLYEVLWDGSSPRIGSAVGMETALL